jgi:putative transposase
MANTYTKVYIQYIFAVQNRISLINPRWEVELYKYITGIVQNQKHKLIAINGIPDHIHVFVGMYTTQSMSELMQDVKEYSSKWINKNGYTKGKFQWQDGYGAFSYSKSHIDNVYKYIMNQKEHHKKKTFIEEYIEFLEKFEVPYDERYIFKPVE